ncbi:MAG: hypothetical protein V2A76_13835 [Planctomycetota bacterium]
MSSSKDRIARQLVQKALEFQRLAPWKEFDNQDFFLVEIPGEEHPAVGVVMGAAGIESGFVLYRGQDALLLLLRSLEGEPLEQVAGEQSSLSLLFARLDEIPPPCRRILDQAGFSARREASAPLFMSKPAGRQFRTLQAREQQVLLYGVSAFLAAWQDGSLEPLDIRSRGSVQTLVVSGKPAQPDVRVTESPFPEYRPAPAIDLDLADLEITGACWLVTLTDLGAVIEGEVESTRTLLVMDDESGMILCCETTLGIGIEKSVQSLEDLFRGGSPNHSAGLPREMKISSKSLLDPLQATLTAAGIKVKYVADQPRLEEVVAKLRAALQLGPTPSQPVPEEPVPWMPQDPVLARWKAEELELFEMIGDLLDELSNEEYRAMQRYFGEPDLGDRLLDDLEQYSAPTAFDEWRAAHYRHTRQSRTLVETLLGGDLSPEKRALLLARQQATPSLYKVEETDPAKGHTLLSDLFTDEQVTVHDFGLAGSLHPNFAMPLALLPAGPFTFALPQGPPFSILAVDGALDWLRKRGLKSTREAFARKPHLLGRIWEWFAGFLQAGPPRVTNTDGHALAWQTASFSLEDPDAVHRYLAERDDVDQPPAGEEEVYHWLDVESETLLGRIEIIGNELILQVNSKERLEQARAFLEQAPGVRFESVQTKDIFEDEAPLDDRLPGPKEPPPTAEMTQFLRDFLQKKAMDWLDEKIPALGGKTPRQAVKTKAGRQKVALLIRTWPDQDGPDGSKISPPRKKMLRELGLE